MLGDFHLSSERYDIVKSNNHALRYYCFIPDPPGTVQISQEDHVCYEP